MPTPTNDSRHLIKRRQNPDKGLGLFALKPIAKGTRILAEKGPFNTQHLKQDLDIHPHAQLQMFDKLPQKQKIDFLQLRRFSRGVNFHSKFKKD